MKTYNGKTQSVAEWIRELNLPAKRTRHRLESGWDFKRAVEEPAHVKNIPKIYAN